MPRKSRVILEGAIYHIYQRGNNREHIFENPKHKAFLIKQIIEEAIKNKHKLKEIGEFKNTSQPAISNILAYYKAKDAGILISDEAGT